MTALRFQTGGEGTRHPWPPFGERYRKDKIQIASTQRKTSGDVAANITSNKTLGHANVTSVIIG